METMHFHKAHTKNNFLRTTLYCFQRLRPNEQFGIHEKLSWVQGRLNWMPGSVPFLPNLGRNRAPFPMPKVSFIPNC